jgi:hypothetical protein
LTVGLESPCPPSSSGSPSSSSPLSDSSTFHGGKCLFQGKRLSHAICSIELSNGR